MHGDNSFITLTHREDTIPLSSGSHGVPALPTLNPKLLQDWLKRFRKAIEPSRIRYFAVGEYGDETQRPHYHVALFGFPSCRRGGTKRKYGLYGPLLWSGCCPSCSLVGETWGHGDVHLGTLALESAQYLAGYVTKKMTSQDDPRLDGRHPEFSRQSLRPGIGHSSLHEIAHTLLGLATREADVPSALRHGGRLLPLGRYLRRELRALVGMEKTSPSVLTPEGATLHRLSLPSPLTQEQKAQRLLNLESKTRIQRKGKPL